LKPRRRTLLARSASLLAWGALFGAPALAGSYEDYFLGIELDRPGIVRPLLVKGFDVNARDPEGQHGLYLALRENSNEVAELLLAHPQLDADATNKAGETLLMMAAMRGRLDAMRQLIARGAAINREGWTPLHYAASGDFTAATRLLLDLGAHVDARAPNGNTPLMMAAGFGSIDGAVELVRHGADPSLRNKAGVTASEFARRAGRDGLADQLDKLAASRPSR
jgi:ankyrin repeat protein